MSQGGGSIHQLDALAEHVAAEQRTEARVDEGVLGQKQPVVELLVGWVLCREDRKAAFLRRLFRHFGGRSEDAVGDERHEGVLSRARSGLRVVAGSATRPPLAN